ncbi:hypothetical protein FRC02_009589 [Tulasnella sp. 418]|nr:hypothetical protein FRC02_009589 [Tulasnella sp. 418]
MVALGVIFLLTLWGLASLAFTPNQSTAISQQSDKGDVLDHRLILADTTKYLNGPPMNSFRENLKEDSKYVTGWNFAGMTNDFMVYINLIYLGMISSRVPIIPPFIPASVHLGKGGLIKDFSEFFDLPGLRAAVNHPILEWSQVKKGAYAGNTMDLEDVVDEPIGCWSNWQPFGTNGKPIYTELSSFLKLDISYTPVPDNVKLSDKGNHHSSYWGMVSLLYPEGRAKALRQKEAVASYSPRLNQSLPPDDQLACFDILYYAAVRDTYEWERDYSPAWNLVGQYARFSRRLEDISMSYIRKVFNVGRNEDIPPVRDILDSPVVFDNLIAMHPNQYISIHVRRSDFADRCGKNKNKEDCFLPLSTYDKEVQHIKAELADRHGPASPLSKVNHVLVTSDEKDSEWWGTVRQQGWYFIDHGSEKTSDALGKWYPSFIDAFAQSRGVGFVGTLHSTMSLVAARRVQYWNDGPTRMVYFN